MGYSREHELLVCCARTRGAHIVGRLRELAATGVDWEYLFLLARRHAVLPLVYLQLERHASDLVPAESLRKFKKHFQENSARNTVLTAELCRLISLFADSGIESIPYKGPVLGLIAYDNIALRRFVDLDVIVKKADVLKARDILLAEGYTPAKSLSLSQQELLLRVWERERKTVLFVTHDIEEAIFLGSRVLVMTARPGRIKAEVTVDLPHPRHYTIKTSPEFSALKARLTEEIRVEAVLAAEEH